MKAFIFGLGFSALSLNAASWHYEVAPYLWASSMEGEQQSGSHRFHVNESFIKLLKHLDFGAMLYTSAYRDNWGVFFNGIYSKVSDSVNLDTLSIHTSSAMTIDSAGTSHRFNYSNGAIEPYVGARYTLNNTKISIDTLPIKQKYNWTDAIIGTRLFYNISSAFNIEGSADYGQGGHSHSYNLSALLGYQSPTHFQNTRFYLGYRYLHQNYHHGEGKTYYLWDMNLFGPIAGFAYRF